MVLKSPKWLSGEDLPRNQKISRAQEKRTAQALGTKLTIGSGNKGQKGDSQDMFGSEFRRMIENKVTDKKSMSVKREWLEKLSREAFAVSREPVFVFGFSEIEFGSRDWGAVPLDRLSELFEAEAELKELKRS